MLGTPNLGSFVPVQALRGIYPVVRKVAALDQRHSAEQLAEQVFSSFPGLYQMLPFAAHWQELDLCDPRTWPAVGPRPRPEPLQQAPLSQQGLAEPDASFLLIAGVNQETITALRLQDGEFVYHETLEGDGTVPLAFAQLPGVKTWYVEESHGSLPNNGKVADAVKDLLARGVTDALPEHWTPSRRGVVRALRDSQLQQPAFGGRSGDAIRESELRQLIEELAAPPSLVTPGSSDAGAGPGSYAHALSQVVVGRRRQHRLDVRLAQGSIDQVDSAPSCAPASRSSPLC